MTSPLLELDDIRVTFGTRSRLPWNHSDPVIAVDGVSLSIAAGETVGLVGESGSGKSTLGRTILRFIRPDGGDLRFGEMNYTDFGRSAPLPFRRAVQVVFQDPFGSLNPFHTIGEIVGEPAHIHLGLRGDELRRRCADMLETVGLREEHLDRLPHEFSGGQRQRIAIARALISEPQLVVLDEPVSALDVSTQASVVNLLEELQQELGVAYLFIAHDLAVVRHASDRIAVMYRGRIVEQGPADRVCERPAHPYTAVLLASAPDPDPQLQRQQRERRRHLEVATEVDRPSAGCTFAPRCAHALDVCWTDVPAATPVDGGGTVACHLHTAGPQLAGQPVTVLLDD